MTIDLPRPHQLPALRRLWQEAFGDSETELDRFFGTAYAPNRCRVLTEEGAVLSALYWLDCSVKGKRLAYLYAIATAKAARGRGLCSTLMADTHRHLAELGYAGAILVPGEKSLFEFYEKMGYKTYCHVGELRCHPSNESVAFRAVSPEEYARLRRVLLPVGSVIQEGESLRFLETQAMLYAGEAWLLAARREGNVLRGLELLGNRDAASAMTGMLSCAEGRFRVPGGELPFAMLRPLGDEPLPSPSYFGLAFD